MTWRRNIILGVIFSTVLWAQSPLQLYGLGAPQSADEVTSDGAGDIRSLPLTDGDAYPFSVASWHHLSSTQLRVTLASQMSMVPAEDPRYSSGLRRLMFLVHLDNRSAIGFGFSPLTQTNITLVDDSPQYILGSDTLFYRQVRRVVGGVSSLQVGYSRQLGRSVSIGIALDVLFGTLFQYDTLQFNETGARDDLLSWLLPADRFLGAERIINFLGRNLELNLTADALPLGRSQLGVRINMPLSLRARIRTRFINTPPFTELRNNDMQLPLSLNVGYAMNIGERQRVMAEWGLQLWAESEANDLVYGRHFEQINSWAASWTFKPAAITSAKPGRMFYRMGFNRKSYYLSDLKNSPLGEVSVSVGMGVRSLRTAYKLDIALQYGQRDGLFEMGIETFGRLSIGVTTGEIWFARPKKNWN